MRPTTLSLAVLSLSLCVSAQPRSSNISTQAAIQYVKTLSTSLFDGRLPRISLEYFLSYESGSAQGKWGIVECEKQAAPAPEYTKQDFPICIQADYDVKSMEHPYTPTRSLSRGGSVTVLISVKTAKNGKFRGGTILNLVVTDVFGAVHQVRNLADLPMELHRPPPTTPKDLPLPVG